MASKEMQDGQTTLHNGKFSRWQISKMASFQVGKMVSCQNSLAPILIFFPPLIWIKPSIHRRINFFSKIVLT